MVGYLLKNTVSDNGTVSRGVCQQENGHLQKVKETLKIKKYPDGRIADLADPDHPTDLDPESVVSMNFWGFTPWIFEQMEEYFDFPKRTISSGAESRVPAACPSGSTDHFWSNDCFRPAYRCRLVRRNVSGGSTRGGKSTKVST